MPRNFEITTLEAPIHWASALINGDYSGLEYDSPKEAQAIEKWAEGLGALFVGVSDESNFMRHHDAAHISPLAADCATYTLHAEKCSLTRVKINSGGYDPQGNYWGVGAPLWLCDVPSDDGRESYKRAATRDDAKALFRKAFPLIAFYR